MRDVMQWNRRGVFCLIAVLIIGLGGCTGKKSTTSMEGDDGEMATLASSVSNYNDIELPAEMKRAMAKQAEAERERRSRIIMADGEYQAAAKMAEAAKLYAETPIAVKLREFQMLSEVAREKNLIIIAPSTIPEVATTAALVEGISKRKTRE